MVGDENTNVEDKMAQFDRIHEKIKFKAFGKVTLNSNKKVKYEKKKSVTDDEDRVKELFEEQEKKAEHEIEEIKKKNYLN